MAESSLSHTINAILLNPTYHDPLAIVKAARNGIVYGTKIRFPHALVMVLLFRYAARTLRASGCTSASNLMQYR